MFHSTMPLKQLLSTSSSGMGEMTAKTRVLGWASQGTSFYSLIAYTQNWECSTVLGWWGTENLLH